MPNRQHIIVQNAVLVRIEGGQLTPERLHATRELRLVPGFEGRYIECSSTNDDVAWVLRRDRNVFRNRTCLGVDNGYFVLR